MYKRQVVELGATKINLLARRISKTGNALQAATRLGINPGYIPLSAKAKARETIENADLIISTTPVSYTHLDVYKRQPTDGC